MKINCLEPEVYNKIAAGEVVERPASVIKELVENSIDAGSTNITIEIVEGGIKLMRVTDNGCGIEFDDLNRAFLPHATSKIKNADDLFSIKTLGFRGEALASIGSVAEVTIISKPSAQEFGGQVSISGGKLEKPTEAGSPDGTSICVQNLFFNVPARAKFLKKPKTEEGEITNIVSRFILANPCVAIKYIVDGKLVYLSTGKGIKDAIYTIYGKEATEKTIEVDADFADMKIYGFIGKPDYTKANKTYQTFVLNNRYIINGTIASAVHNAYGDYLMKRQYPFYVLYMDIDFRKVDVNVHPNKLDVRFEDGGKIYIKMFETINRALNNINTIKTISKDNQFSSSINNELEKTKEFVQSVNINSIKISEPSEIKIETDKSKPSEIKVQQDAKDNSYTKNVDEYIYKTSIEELSTTSNSPKQEAKRREIFSGLMRLNGEKTVAMDNISIGSKLLNDLIEEENKIQNSQLSTNKSKLIQSEQYLKNLDTEYKNLEIENRTNNEIVNDSQSRTVIGTIFNTYIILESGDNMYLIDQHAGHERLLFDKYIKQVEEQNVSTQLLLLPYILKVNPLEQNFMAENIEILQNFGFDIEIFGVDTYRISSIPLIFSSINLEKFFVDFLSDLKSYKNNKATDYLRDRIATKACKSAVKGGDRLSEMEINTLLKMFSEEKTQLLCPHGRPVVIKITKTEIEKWFKRIV